jgi:hypothetical protein
MAKKIAEIHATPVFEEEWVFGKMPIVMSDWEGPIEVTIVYDDGSSGKSFMGYEQYMALKIGLEVREDGNP